MHQNWQNNGNEGIGADIRHKAPKTLGILMLSLAFLPGLALGQTCPPLEEYYQAVGTSQVTATSRLRDLMPLCLTNAEYFALYGAALLNRGQVAESLEALERAILLDPDNGAAQIDYAQALYLGQQLFPALEINTRLLNRSDLPVNVRGMLEERQQLWQAQTVSSALQAELSLGYDNNLNGAPLSNELTLTLSGESITLPLAPSFQPQEGLYSNTRLIGSIQKLSPQALHEGYFVLRSRNSEFSGTDLLQFDWRYAQTRSFRKYQWSVEAGTSHLSYGGSPLFSIYEASGQVRRAGSGCKPQAGIVIQVQQYHGQNVVSGEESNLSAGMECRMPETSQVFGFSAGLLNNHATDSQRPGGDRSGWRLSLYWQAALLDGLLNTQLNFINMDDDKGYSPLLAGRAKRNLDNRVFRTRYTRKLTDRLTGLISFSYQKQDSNIKTFANDGAAGEIGLNFQL
jgi:tetratricopeptide (TPR) repeat protein